ncbi:TRAP transporter permease DctQ [Salipaludibacillus keqinensis]|jgi:TRAP-type transport system small permease protein|uniref:TRAP transporter permease DctQ n=1 Tax=Salipaludibacillus keqinensis TaxID=2045207 RepID=A0A323TL28_9BACI|nr:TRAP transporter small permease [Salipaludibacillus keqinensis]PYZ94826.1 TRAP transporter permease DctQ [Salipaludibacillus keqinensis]
MEKFIDSLSKGLHYVAQLILVAMMLMITADVLGRWIFNFPIKGTYDFTQSGLSMMIFLGLAYTHNVKEHISIDFLVEKFPEKVQNIMNSFINIFIAGIIGLLAFQLWGNSQRLFHSNTVTGDLNLPIYIFAIMATIGTTVFALTAVMNAIVYAQKVVSKNES